METISNTILREQICASLQHEEDLPATNVHQPTCIVERVTKQCMWSSEKLFMSKFEIMSGLPPNLCQKLQWMIWHRIKTKWFFCGNDLTFLIEGVSFFTVPRGRYDKKNGPFFCGISLYSSHSTYVEVRKSNAKHLTNNALQRWQSTSYHYLS